MVSNLRFLLSFFDIGISLNDPIFIYLRSFEINHQRIYKGLIFYVGWMRYTLIYNISLSTKACECVFGLFFHVFKFYKEMELSHKSGPLICPTKTPN